MLGLEGNDACAQRFWVNCAEVVGYEGQVEWVERNQSLFALLRSFRRSNKARLKMLMNLASPVPLGIPGDVFDPGSVHTDQRHSHIDVNVLELSL